MIKPAGIKDEKALKYIEFLENQIEEFKTHTKKKFYRGIQRQLDLLGDEMLEEKTRVSIKKEYELIEGKMKLVDSGFDGFFDMMTKGEAIIKAMEKFEQQAFPKEETGKAKMVEGSSAEAHIFKTQ